MIPRFKDRGFVEQEPYREWQARLPRFSRKDRKEAVEQTDTVSNGSTGSSVATRFLTCQIQFQLARLKTCRHENPPLQRSFASAASIGSITCCNWPSSSADKRRW